MGQCRIVLFMLLGSLYTAISGCVAPLAFDPPCVPAACGPETVECGTMLDGCGQIKDCGECPVPLTCGGGGAGRCGAEVCTPSTCNAQGADCGSVHDRCSRILSCGTCEPGVSCGGITPNVCGAACVPRSCEDIGASCGKVRDGCGNILDCGTCGVGRICGDTIPNVCGECIPGTCASRDVLCGEAEDGCGGVLDCGACSSPSGFALDVVVNDAVYDPSRQILWLSVPGDDEQRGNTVTGYYPLRREFGPSLFVGSEPNALALSDDGTYLYVGVDGALSVARIFLPTFEIDLKFQLPPGSPFHQPRAAREIAVMPGAPRTIAVAHRSTNSSPGRGGISIYDDGVARPDSVPDHSDLEHIVFGARAETLFAAGLYVQFSSMAVTETGLTSPNTSTSQVYGALSHVAGKIIAQDGQAIDPEIPQIIGRFGSARGPLVADRASRRVFVADAPSLLANQPLVVAAYDLDSYRLISETRFSGLLVNGYVVPRKVLRWGSDGLAVVVNHSLLMLSSNIVRGG